MILDTQVRPVKGKAHCLTILGFPFLSVCSIVTTNLGGAGIADQIHSTPEALYLAGQHPVRQVTSGTDLHGTEDGQVDATAANHTENSLRCQKRQHPGVESPSPCRH